MRKPENVDQTLWNILTTKEKIFVSCHERLHEIYVNKYQKEQMENERAFQYACEGVINTQLNTR